MNIIKIAFCILCSMYATNIYSWTLFSTNSESGISFYFDSNHQSTNNELIDTQSLESLTIQRKIKKDGKDIYYSSHITKKLFNCSRNSVANYEDQYFSQKMGKGNLVYSEKLNETELNFKPTNSHDFDEAISDLVCNGSSQRYIELTQNNAIRMVFCDLMYGFYDNYMSCLKSTIDNAQTKPFHTFYYGLIVAVTMTLLLTRDFLKFLLNGIWLKRYIKFGKIKATVTLHGSAIRANSNEKITGAGALYLNGPNTIYDEVCSFNIYRYEDSADPFTIGFIFVYEEIGMVNINLPTALFNRIKSLEGNALCSIAMRMEGIIEKTKNENGDELHQITITKVFLKDLTLKEIKRLYSLKEHKKSKSEYRQILSP